MGWRERDYARWTPEERRRFLGTTGASRRPVVTSSVALAVAASALLYGLGHFPRGHPVVPALAFKLPSINSISGGVPKLNVPETHARVRLRSEVVPVRSFLTFRGPVPVGDKGRVIIKGSLNGGRWRTLAVADGISGRYLARIALNHRGKLRLRISFRDGTEAVETVTVR